MKLACMILAYNAASVLARAVPVYRAAGWDVFVHLDPKADRAAYLAALGPAAEGCVFVADPVAIFWAGFSMIEAELKLLALARRSGSYDRFLLLSDDTLPMVPAAHLNAVLAQDRDFITAEIQSPASNNARMYPKFLFPDHPVTALKPTRPPTAEIDERLERAVLEIAGLRKIGKKPVTLYYGSQFWALTAAAVETFLAAHETDLHLRKSFEYSSFSDELYLHTVLANQRYKTGIGFGPVYSDFYTTVGKTRVYAHVRELPFDLESHHLFVRKVSPAAAALLDRAAGLLRDGLSLFGTAPQAQAADRAEHDLGDGTRALTLRLAAPPAGSDAAGWGAPERYLQRLYRWTMRDRMHWHIDAVPADVSRVRFYLPVVLSKPGFLDRAHLTFGGQTKPMVYTRYALIAEFDAAGGSGTATLATPPPQPADPPHDPRLLGIGVAI